MAFAALRHQIVQGTRSIQRTLGFPGGSRPNLTVHWRPDTGIWSHFGTDIKNRYWCCYGTQDPAIFRNLNISVEINPPRGGFDRRISGVFVSEAGGNVFLAHSGKIGGGTKGIGKDAFLNFYRGATYAQVQWPNGQSSEILLIGRIGDQHLPIQVASFVHEVDRFKAAVRAGTSTSQSGPTTTLFTPEFEGPRRPFELNAAIQSSCDHGVIVRYLHDALTELGLCVANDRKQDLFILNEGRVRVLFEVKTSVSPSDLYSGIGQLMLYGAAQVPPPVRVLVVPIGLSDSKKALIESIDVRVLRFAWSNTGPSFETLNGVIGVHLVMPVS